MIKFDNRYDYFKFGFMLTVFLILIGLFFFYNFYAVNSFPKDMLNSIWAAVIFMFTFLGIIFISLAYSIFLDRQDSS